MSKNIMITGGAGFIGSHVIRWFVKNYPDYTIYNLDALTYAGNLENLKDIDCILFDLNHVDTLDLNSKAFLETQIPIICKRLTLEVKNYIEFQIIVR